MIVRTSMNSATIVISKEELEELNRTGCITLCSSLNLSGQLQYVTTLYLEVSKEQVTSEERKVWGPVLSNEVGGEGASAVPCPKCGSWDFLCTYKGNELISAECRKCWHKLV